MKKSTKRRIILAAVAAVLLAAALVLTLTDIVPDPEPLTGEEKLLIVVFLVGPYVFNFLFEVGLYRLRLGYILKKLEKAPNEDNCLWLHALLTEWFGLGRWIWLRGRFKTRFCRRIEPLYLEKIRCAQESENRFRYAVHHGLSRIGMELPKPE